MVVTAFAQMYSRIGADQPGHDVQFLLPKAVDTMSGLPQRMAELFFTLSASALLSLARFGLLLR